MNKNLYFTALVTSTFLMLINCYGETKDYMEQLAQLHKNVISHIFESPVNIILNGTFKGENAEIKNGKTSVKVLLPSAWEAGKTVTVFLDKP